METHQTNQTLPATPQGKIANENDRNIGLRIATIRKSRMLTQSQLASAIGVTFQQVQKYEKGRNRVSSTRLRLLAASLGVSILDLCDDNEDVTAGGVHLNEILATPGAIDLLLAFKALSTAEARDLVLRTARSLSAVEKEAITPHEEAASAH